MKKLLLYLLTAGLLLTYASGAEAQISGFWRIKNSKIRPTISRVVETPSGFSGATSITFSHLRDCTLGTSTQGLVSCSGSSGGGSGGTSTGNVIDIGDARWVQIAGSTSTGTQLMQSGLSGSWIHTQALSVTGSIIVTNTGTFLGTISGSNLTVGGVKDSWFLGNVGIGVRAPGE